MQTKNRKTRRIFFHCLGWILFIGLQTILYMSSGMDAGWRIPFVRYSLNIISFYFIYFLVYRFLFKKQYALFLLFLIISLIGLFYLGDFTTKKLMKPKKITEEERSQQQRKRPPDHIIFIFSSTVFLGASLAVSFGEKWVDMERDKAKKDKENLSSELKYLKSQVNPHFLFNALNNIYALSLKKSEQTTDVVMKLSSLLRYMIYETDKSSVPLEDEIKNINDYVDLQKIRLTDNTKVNIDLSGNPAHFNIEPLLLIPLVENAFKYGTSTTVSSNINIDIQIQEQKLFFSISNDIVNHESKTDIKEDSGIGLKNLIRRLELLYPDNFKLKKHIKENKFYISLNLNLKK